MRILPIEQRRKLLKAKDYTVLYALENNRGIYPLLCIGKLIEAHQVEDMHKNGILLLTTFELADKIIPPLCKNYLTYWAKQGFAGKQKMLISFEIFKHVLNDDKENEEIKEAIINKVNSYYNSNQQSIF